MYKNKRNKSGNLSMRTGIEKRMNEERVRRESEDRIRSTIDLRLRVCFIRHLRIIIHR